MSSPQFPGNSLTGVHDVDRAVLDLLKKINTISDYLDTFYTDGVLTVDTVHTGQVDNSGNDLTLLKPFVPASSFSDTLKAERDSSLNNVAAGGMRVSHKTTANMVDEFGSGIVFQIEDDTSGPVTSGAVTTARAGADDSSDLVLQTPNAGILAEKLRLTKDGRLYGTALHNNAGAVTGTTNQYIASGTYTPTLTNAANVAASTSYPCQWMRVGNVVTVSGRVDIDVTAASVSTSLRMTLPIASSFAVTGNGMGGTAIANTGAGQMMSIYSDNATGQAVFQNTAGWVTITNIGFWFSFIYLIS